MSENSSASSSSIGVAELFNPNREKNSSDRIELAYTSQFPSDALSCTISKLFAERDIDDSKAENIIDEFVGKLKEILRGRNIGDDLLNNIGSEILKSRDVLKSYLLGGSGYNGFVGKIAFLRAFYEVASKAIRDVSRGNIRKELEKKLQRYKQKFLCGLLPSIRIDVGSVPGELDKVARSIGRVVEALNNIDGCKFLAFVSEVYGALVTDYKLFDNFEWLLVLLNRWAKVKDNKNYYLPICPTREDAFLVYYYYVYRCCTTSGDSGCISCDVEVRVMDLIELVSALLNIRS